MENFIVSARKYRPATFETVVGQHHITGTLKNAIKNNQLAQAFLFCGPRGVGKTTCARILAKTINCTQQTADMEACGKCESCVSFQTGNSFNFHELDAASNNSVDDIRSLIEQVRIPPQAGKYKIYIIDEVHMLSANAFNAFLKTLEEPPAYAIFILATTEKHKILPTILSRCQIFDFNRIQVDDIALHLQKIAEREQISVETDGLHIIAQKADGGLRDALSMFDQIVSFTNKNLTYKAVIENLNILDYDYYFRLTGFLTSADVSKSLLLFDEILNNGFDGNNFINGLAGHLRNLLVAKDPQTTSLLEVSENIRKKYLEQSQQTSVSFILTALNLANQCDLIYKNSKNQRLQVELSLIKMCHIPSVIQLAQQPLPAANQQTDEAQLKKKTNLNPAPVQKQEPAVPAPDPLPAPSGYSQVIAQPTAQPAAQPVTSKPRPDLNTSQKIVLKPNPMGAGNGATLIPSLNALNAIAEGLDNDKPKFVVGEAAEPFTHEGLMELWNFYIQKAKTENKINFYTILNTNEPELSGPNEITVHITNLAQESILQQELVEFLNFLRTRLNNYAINIKTKKVEGKLENRLYTSIDKYHYLLEKNPKLEDLRKKFNLDLLP
ncbi:DNA polymerase III subunit gamma/tau [Pedobacter antarcticus]|uniref:DNA polymerase III subunit gamma/tau n=1 Tax=Pedobacter antarcticus TaxID=34086 RepID=UPI00292F6990|nr:DNA polymerase III subunit gamma/tau [Pedobacter antarcticus]